MKYEIKELRLDVANKIVEMQSSFAQAVNLTRERYGLEAAKAIAQCNTDVVQNYAVPRLNELLVELENTKGLVDIAVICSQIEITFTLAEDIFMKQFAQLREMINNGTLKYKNQIERWNLSLQEVQL